MLSRATTITLKEYYAYLNNEAQIVYADLPGNDITLENFLDCANTISKYISERKPYNKELVFSDAGDRCPDHHIVDTKCKPDIIAVLRHKGGASKNSDSKLDPDQCGWPRIGVVGEKASAGKSKAEQGCQAISYLYYLILARPDLYVAHSLLIDKAGVTFFAGLTGNGIFSLKLPYNDENLRPLLCVLINHIYDPGKFKDNTCKVIYQKEIGFRYTISLKTASGDTECSNLKAIYATNPFETTTYVYAITDDIPPIDVNNEQLRVIKDQYCRYTRFNEPQILEKLHDTPGVVKMVHNEVLQLPVNPDYRMKRRLGFSQYGYPLMNVETVREMLEVLYDTLEVTRYMRFKNSVLGRDLSIGNIVVDKNVTDKNVKPTVPMPDKNAAYQNNDGEYICFIKHLLGESNDPLETSTVFIDFNRAELMDTTTSHPQGDRTVCLRPGQHAVDRLLLLDRAHHFSLREPCRTMDRIHSFLRQDLFFFLDYQRRPPTYQACHAERVKKFPANEDHTLLGKHAVLAERDWRHELYHDAESIFWIFLYWLMLANPEPGNKPESEPIKTARWEMFVQPDVNGRSDTLENITRSVKQFVHSKLYPISALLVKLAAATYPGPYYLPDSDPRTRPDYLHEFFQRAILSFIFTNKDAEFMHLKMNISRPRKVVMTKTRNTPPQTNAHLTTGDSSRTGSKRASPNPSEGEQDTPGEGPSKKSRRKGPETSRPSKPSTRSQSSTQEPASA